MVSKKSVLLIDDSQSIREILKIYLMSHDANFVDAGSAEDGLRLLEDRKHTYKLVICDIKLPKKSGIDFVREVRASSREDLRTVPIILLTGQGTNDIRQQGMEAGASAFLEKPITSAALNELIKKVLPQP